MKVKPKKKSSLRKNSIMAKKNKNANLVQKGSANSKKVLAEGGDEKYV